MNDVLPRVTLTRRTLLATGVSLGIASGFARAVSPVADSTIYTDASGLDLGQGSVEVEGGKLPLYYARPAGGTQLPVVIVVQEVFGVHEHIQDLCRRLARQGYLAVAPELYFRQGDPRQYSDISELMSKIVSQVPDAQVLADLDQTVAWAGNHGGDAQRVALTGFCWGGRIAWLYATHNPKLKAIAAWYGRLMGQPSANNPQQPIDLVKQLKVPVMGFYGGKDQGITQDSVGKMRAALQAAGRFDVLNVYPEAGHGFNADYRASYNAAAATDAWAKMLAFFRHHGV
ncbi:carboxymethylenebutenolidase [Andreprevotia lacus DSM 23236]|jgi:carboxymethylenebutenolidase|uniref:Carboxymethylenebutenolidase n=1 Tax=Andreprevotia lacus DSM 23236 TaxID=1121001 RepID=A0A1W1XYV0_9NEIS|nr:dienelactone hydrolase family protein [Andreprevotia lacus]SMC29044.1 carboxymethylenebutenolidase [Andreprevotia lacus DSM 23236]